MRLTKGAMFTKKSKADMLLDAEIETMLRHMSVIGVDSAEYESSLRYLETLYTLKGKPPSSVSKDTMATIGANLLGILMILKHERMDIITSKALNFVMKVHRP